VRFHNYGISALARFETHLPAGRHAGNKCLSIAASGTAIALAFARRTPMRSSAILRTALFLTASVAAFAQPGEIRSGTNISVRTNESIDVRNSTDGRIYTGVVDRDVLDANGNVAIPRGSNAELIVRNVGKRDLVLDMESVNVNGHRYVVSTNDITRTGGKQGLGENKRTAKYVGGGAVLGTIIGAIAGGGKGAAIGAAAGAASGAGAQVLTRGGAVRVPAESVLTFRLDQPLFVGGADNGYTRKGRHYHYR
jgi:hypothetical protein